MIGAELAAVIKHQGHLCGIMYLGHYSIQLIDDVETQHALFEQFCPEVGQNSIFVCYMMA